MTPRSPSPVPPDEGAAPAEILLQREDRTALRSVEQSGLGLSELPAPSPSSGLDLLSRADQEVAGVADTQLQDGEATTLGTTDESGLGLRGHPAPSAPAMLPQSTLEVAAIDEILQRYDTTVLQSMEQLRMGLSEQLIPFLSSGSGGSSRSEQEVAALVDVPLQRDDSASLQAMTGQRRGMARSFSSPPMPSSRSSRSSRSSWLPQTLRADFARLHMKLSEAAREKNAALEEARRKVALLLREREESNGAARTQAALRQRAEDEAALARVRLQSLREHAERDLSAAQQNAEDNAAQSHARHESLRGRLERKLAAQQRKAGEDAERARERNESLCEQMTAAATAAAAAEAAAVAAEAEVAERAREAMAVEERMKDRVRAAEKKAEDEVGVVISWRCFQALTVGIAAVEPERIVPGKHVLTFSGDGASLMSMKKAPLQLAR